MRVETVRAAPNGGVPNNPALPAVLVRGAVDGMDADAVRRTVEANGWGGTWVWTVFDHHHFHPDAHEALAVVAGRARLLLGGPEGTEVEVSAGDVAVLPAGFGHCLLSSDGGFRVVGAYPPGQEGPSIVRAGQMDVDDALRQIADVPLPGRGPVEGVTLEAWGIAGA